jgi:hypothetical protein
MGQIGEDKNETSNYAGAFQHCLIGCCQFTAVLTRTGCYKCRLSGGKADIDSARDIAGRMRSTGISFPLQASLSKTSNRIPKSYCNSFPRLAFGKRPASGHTPKNYKTKVYCRPATRTRHLGPQGNQLSSDCHLAIAHCSLPKSHLLLDVFWDSRPNFPDATPEGGGG